MESLATTFLGIIMCLLVGIMTLSIPWAMKMSTNFGNMESTVRFLAKDFHEFKETVENQFKMFRSDITRVHERIDRIEEAKGV